MSRIAATYTEDASGTGSYDNGVAFCPRVPAVIYQALPGHRARGSWTEHSSREDAIGEAALNWIA